MANRRGKKTKRRNCFHKNLIAGGKKHGKGHVWGKGKKVKYRGGNLRYIMIDRAFEKERKGRGPYGANVQG